MRFITLLGACTLVATVSTVYAQDAGAQAQALLAAEDISAYPSLNELEDRTKIFNVYSTHNNNVEGEGLSKVAVEEVLPKAPVERILPELPVEEGLPKTTEKVAKNKKKSPEPTEKDGEERDKMKKKQDGQDKDKERWEKGHHHHYHHHHHHHHHYHDDGHGKDGDKHHHDASDRQDGHDEHFGHDDDNLRLQSYQDHYGDNWRSHSHHRHHGHHHHHNHHGHNDHRYDDKDCVVYKTITYVPDCPIDAAAVAANPSADSWSESTRLADSGYTGRNFIYGDEDDEAIEMEVEDEDEGGDEYHNAEMPILMARGGQAAQSGPQQKERFEFLRRN
ncbi:hypothetical protein EDD11_005326 [Mortierella claussenii]|nr:hypothetical protein EDD11_005326 [Mortierella claussenii]